MNAERWARVEEVFGEALEIPLAERATYLAEATRDDAELRAAPAVRVVRKRRHAAVGRWRIDRHSDVAVRGIPRVACVRGVAAIARSVDALESEVEGWPEALDMAQVSTGCALAYLDIRLKDLLDWREGHPKTARWYEAFAQRPSMVSSVPQVAPPKGP